MSHQAEHSDILATYASRATVHLEKKYEGFFMCIASNWRFYYSPSKITSAAQIKSVRLNQQWSPYRKTLHADSENLDSLPALSLTTWAQNEGQITHLGLEFHTEEIAYNFSNSFSVDDSKY